MDFDVIGMCAYAHNPVLLNEFLNRESDMNVHWMHDAKYIPLRMANRQRLERLRMKRRLKEDLLKGLKKARTEKDRMDLAVQLNKVDGEIKKLSG